MTLAATSSAGDSARRSCSEAAMSVAAARDRFRARMEEAFKLLVALDGAVKFGSLMLAENAKRFPDADLIVGVGHPNEGKVRTAPMKMREAVEALQAHPQLPVELVHGLVIQWWYEFLQEAFEALFREHLTGSKRRDKFERIGLRLEAGDGLPLLDAVVVGAGRDFSFEPAHTRLPKLAKVLNVKLDEENVALQKRHIVVRNVIEHAGGVLRSDDLRLLGVASIELLNEHHAPAEFRAGERVVLTLWEALRPVRHLAELADELAVAAG